MPKNRTFLTYYQKVLVIALRFGSLTDFSTVQRSFYKIAAAIRSSFETVRRTVAWFIKDGYKVVNNRYKKTQCAIYREDISKYLTDPKVLKSWGSFPILQRVDLIKEKFDVTVCNATLTNFYNAHGIRYIKPYISTTTLTTGNYVKKYERFLFAHTLSSLMMKNENIVFMDETSIYGWMNMSKQWCHTAPELKTVIHLPMKRARSVTVYGAVGECIPDRLYFELGPNTNQYDFIYFLENLHKKINKHLGTKNVKPYMVLDNHSAHWTADAKKALDKKFRPLWIPTSSCTLNSCEYVWNVFKQSLRKKLFEHGLQKSKLYDGELHNYAEEVLNAIPQ